MKSTVMKALAFTSIVCSCTTFSQASYTVNGTELNQLFNGPTGQIQATPGNADDTVMLEFKDKGLVIKWGELKLDAKGKNELGELKLKENSGIMSFPSLEFNSVFVDEGGFLGGDRFETVKITAQQLSFLQTSISFKNTAQIRAPEASPALIRMLSFSKKDGTKYPLIMGKVDFTRKDDNFSGIDKLPHFLISGIDKLTVTIDKRKA